MDEYLGASYRFHMLLFSRPETSNNCKVGGRVLNCCMPMTNSLQPPQTRSIMQVPVMSGKRRSEMHMLQSKYFKLLGKGGMTDRASQPLQQQHNSRTARHSSIRACRLDCVNPLYETRRLPLLRQRNQLPSYAWAGAECMHRVQFPS